MLNSLLLGLSLSLYCYLVRLDMGNNMLGEGWGLKRQKGSGEGRWSNVGLWVGGVRRL